MAVATSPPDDPAVTKAAQDSAKQEGHHDSQAASLDVPDATAAVASDEQLQRDSPSSEEDEQDDNGAKPPADSARASIVSVDQPLHEDYGGVGFYRAIYITALTACACRARRSLPACGSVINGL